jgi:aspartyl protease family protein
VPEQGRTVLRAAFLIVVVATMVGALMPSRPAAPAAGNSAAPLPSDAPVEDTVLTVADNVSNAGSSSGSGTSVILERAPDGHFYADARVNGASVRFLVDTGASGVALAQEDARRAGIPISPSSFQVIGRGASGEVRGESVVLERVSLGHKDAQNLPGVILEGSEQSLLGQNFLRSFESVSIADDRMVLR